MIPLTIGMAVYDDFKGLAWTLWCLGQCHEADLDGCEILVVDNHPTGPDTPTGRQIRQLVASTGTKRIEVRYIECPEPVGTSAPRDTVFREATREAVCCADSHVIFAAHAVRNLREYFTANPDSLDLVSGPLMSGTGRVYATHFDDVWRSGMWGIWGRDQRGDDPDGGPFEIPGMGLGLFACRKDAWLGFHPDARGFGGEEMYIHEKFRRAGARCLCLPPVRWFHDFGKRGQYPNRMFDKVRNYMLEFRELRLPLDRLQRHFVFLKGEQQPDGKIAAPSPNPLPQAQWDRLLAEVDSVPRPQRKRGGCGGAAKQQPKPAKPLALRPHPRTLEELYLHAAATPSDINHHLPKLRELASQCESVTEFGTRYGRSTTAFLAAQPKRLAAYDRRRFPQVDTLEAMANGCEFTFHVADVLEMEPIEPTDFLFIDTKHTADQLRGELAKHAGQARRWIAMHDTTIYGEKGEGGKPGLLVALREFLRANPEWSIIYHAAYNHGLTVISRDPRDKPKLPPLAKRVRNFVVHAAEHAADKLADVDDATYQKRIDVCATCTLRNAEHCSACGCPIAKKAAWRSSRCDLGLWEAAK